MTIRSLCLFCGSRDGVEPAGVTAATAFGRMVADRRLTLVYGGGGNGLMGHAARAALADGARVVGILPECLAAQEVAQTGLTELIVTVTLHERKAAMFARSDAVVVLPGGIGTMDELFELLTWKNLQLHAKPIYLVGTVFWTPFVDLLRHLDAAGFAYPGLFALFEVVTDIPALATALDRHDR